MYMKYILVLFSFLVWSSFVYAEHKSTDNDTIKVLVKKLKKAAPLQRRLLMNELKVQLRTMHQETRTQVMLQLRHSFNKQQRGQHKYGASRSNAHKKNTMSMTESKHMQEHMNQSNMQRKRPDRKRPVVNRPTAENTSNPNMSTQKSNIVPMRGM